MPNIPLLGLQTSKNYAFTVQMGFVYLTIY